MTRGPARGTVVLVALDHTLGHEQRGVRPCVVVSPPEIVAHQSFPMVAAVPLTGTPGEGLLYPELAPGPSGLRRRSWALVEQIRSVDKRHIVRRWGTVREAELARIDEALVAFLGLAR